MLVPLRVAAVFGGLTTLPLHLTVPTGVWLISIVFLMPGKRSYVNARPGCLTQEQLRRQERDRAFLPQPPPPPLPKAPRRSAWEDLVDTCESATQCDPPIAAEQAEPPLSGKFLDTINRALGIIELQFRPCLDAVEALPKQPIRQLLLEPLISLPLVEAPLTLSETICMPPAPLLVDAPLALKEVIYYQDHRLATGCYYIGEEENNDGINALPEHFDTAADDAEGPFTPAQNIVLDREINATVMKILDPLIDMIIAKVVVMIETNVKTAIDPILDLVGDVGARGVLMGAESVPASTCSVGSRDVLMGAGRPAVRDPQAFEEGEQTAISAEEEEGPNSAAQHNLDNDFRLNVQTSMKRYCFKRIQGDHNSMQIHRLHVENGFELVRYFEKLVRDEISTSNSAPDLSDPNLMHSDQFNTGDTLQDCTDFDEPMNDFHSTAACAQLLPYSLSGSHEPTP